MERAALIVDLGPDCRAIMSQCNQFVANCRDGNVLVQSPRAVLRAQTRRDEQRLGFASDIGGVPYTGWVDGIFAQKDSRPLHRLPGAFPSWSSFR